LKPCLSWIANMFFSTHLCWVHGRRSCGEAAHGGYLKHPGGLLPFTIVKYGTTACTCRSSNKCWRCKVVEQPRCGQRLPPRQQALCGSHVCLLVRYVRPRGAYLVFSRECGALSEQRNVCKSSTWCPWLSDECRTGCEEKSPDDPKGP
jgi:hypothetical protein